MLSGERLNIVICILLIFLFVILGIAITICRIDKIAIEKGVRAKRTEKDYLISWVLCGIANTISRFEAW